MHKICEIDRVTNGYIVIDFCSMVDKVGIHIMCVALNGVDIDDDFRLF